MAGKKIDVSNYGIFGDAIQTTNDLNNKINSSKEKINSSISTLNNDGVFKGPVCDEVVKASDEVKSKLTANSEAYSKISETLKSDASEYSNSDKKAAKNVTGDDSSKKVEARKTDSNSPNFSGNNNEEKLYNYLSSQGFNDAAICGILANIEYESGFDTSSLGDGGTSYGICQWHNERWDSLKSYCEENNLDSDSIEGQAQYLVTELKDSYPDVYNTLQNVPNTADGAYEAAYKWTTDFEIPADTHNQGTSRGNAAATTYWDEYGNKSKN